MQPATTSSSDPTQQAVKDLVGTPAALKREIKLDHSLIMSEVQLLLAEKRTSYALLRTGVTVALVPLSIWTVLLATSRLYNVFDELWLFAPLMLIAVGLLALGAWLVLHALARVRRVDATLTALRKSDTLIEDLLAAR